jgi:sporulation protein YlmC with PRC-barrel domain
MENKTYTITFKDDITVYSWRKLLEMNGKRIPINYGDNTTRQQKQCITVNGMSISNVYQIIVDADTEDGIVVLIFSQQDGKEICRKVMRCDESFVINCNGFTPEYRFEVVK